MRICYLCKSEKINIFHKGVRDNANVDVMKCEKCGLLQLSDFFHLEENFYENGKMHEGNYDVTEDKIINQSWQAWGIATAEDDLRRVESIKEKCEGKEILDFGCGNGGFLRNIKKYTSIAVGVELDNQARVKMAEEGIEAKSSIEEWKGKQFDIITMFQVIEHLNNPEEYLKIIHSFLKPDGVLVIETPNAEDALISLYDCEAFKDFTFWSEHIILYNSDTLKKMVCNNQFELLDSEQIQRYPLSNHLYWLANGKPGGHKKWQEFNDSEVSKAYVEILKKKGQCDTLFFEFKKRNTDI